MSKLCKKSSKILFFKGITKISEAYLLKNIRILFSIKLMKTEN